MNNIGRNYIDIRYMDTMASGETIFHQLDPRIKLVTTMLFIIAVVSFDKYTISPLIPFFIYPVIMISGGDLPAGYLIRKVIQVSPFAILIGIFNPFLDREIITHIGSIGFSGGWISFISIIIRFVLTISAALILISLTGFNAVCMALSRLGVPDPFVVQLLFFFRYIFVLVDEAGRMEMARAARAFNTRARPFRVFISVIGHLLLRSFDRAERVYIAMRCRGFDGDIRLVRRIEAGWKDIGFLVIWTLLFVLFRFENIPIRVGGFVMEIIK